MYNLRLLKIYYNAYLSTALQNFSLHKYYVIIC